MTDIRQSYDAVFGDPASATATLTTDYADNISQRLDIERVNQVGLDISYAFGAAESANTLDLKVEFSNAADPTATTDADWFQEVAESTSGGDITVSQAERSFTPGRFHVSFPVDAMWMRLSIKETGLATNGGAVTIKVSVTEEH